MDYLKTVLLALSLSSVFADGRFIESYNVSPWGRIGLLGIWNDITEGFSSFANVTLAVESELRVLSDNNNLNIQDGTISPDAYLNITELATKYGYSIEEHQVITDDGYILTVHRVKGRSNRNASKIVFLMHGILDSSDSWLLQGPENALGYILADNGYDVWMGNARGNKHSLAHTTLDPKESYFWDFTWEEIGLNDLPAMIDYVLNVTKQPSLYYVGYSQGTTAFFVMASMKLEYNAKVELMFALAPVAWLSDVKSLLLQLFSPAHNVLAYLFSNFNTKSPTTDFFNKVAATFCSHLQARCENLLNMIGGYEYRNINRSLVPVILGHMPTTASTMQFVHYGQLVYSGRFGRYDFGMIRNLFEYGKIWPPDYDVTKISVPVELFYSDSDWLSAETDVDILKSKLSNVVGHHLVQDFYHLDYSYASRAKMEVYNKILLKLNEKENENEMNDHKTG